MNKIKLIGFYVYVDTHRDGTVFYVGKGSGGRFYQKFRSSKWLEVVRGDGGHTRKLISQGLTEKDAFELESSLVKKYSSTVVNYSGKGRGKTHSLNTRQKIASALMGNRNGAGHTKGKGIKGHSVSVSARIKISRGLKGNTNGSGNKGRKFTPETILRMRQSRTNYLNRR